jgi:aminopeptidase 2
MKIILQPIRPTHYALTLFPTLKAPFIYQGHVSITFQSVANGLAPSNQIVLNSKDLKVHSASLAFISKGEPVSSSHSNPRLQATSIIYNTQDETVTLKFGQDIIIAKDDLAILHVEFEGTHNDQMCGFYRSSYTLKTGEKEFMLSSHFEPADARRAFPCIDEPMMKATFDVTLHAPANGYVCLSNMPVVNQKEVKIVDAATGHAVNLQKYCFATTPLMSTYLLAFVVGKLEYVEQTAHLPNTSQEIPCRVYTVPGKRDEGLYSVDLACRVVEFFSSYFKIDYPLPKMDLVGIPDFPIGAMENFGLLTFRLDRLLFNESTGSSESKIRISYIVAHEIAHQWFGNLTTMKWWDELWLKEGFATFVGWLAIDHLFPDWDVFTLFLSRETVKGLALDALQASHPVRVDVSNPAEVGEIFDAISYCKGASIIRMLECYLGREVFAKGVCEYLKENLWSNADGNDLWRALNAASSGRIKVEEFMKNWTDEMGFPLLEVISEEYDSAAQEMVVEIRQSRFISSGDNSNDSQTVWNIPIGLYTYSPSASKSTYILFDSKQGKIRFPFQASPTSFWKFNADSAGFYYSFYLPQHYELLANSIERDPSCLSSKDKYGLLNETYYLLKTYRMTLSSYLVFLKCFKTESDF